MESKFVRIPFKKHGEISFSGEIMEYPPLSKQEQRGLSMKVPLEDESSRISEELPT